MKKIANDTSDDILRIRKIIEQKDKEEKEDKLKKPIVDRQKYFIMNLPFNIFMMLMSKGGVDLTGFIKAVKLTDEDYKIINNLNIITNFIFKHNIN